MTYPNAVRAANQPILEAGPAKIAAAEQALVAAADDASAKLCSESA
jgi:hypothetical protein